MVDLKRCVGCHTCAVACKLGSNLPDGVWWNRVLTHGGRVMDTAQGRYPNVKMQYLTLACQHCSDPPCVKSCPTGATEKRADGVVTQEYKQCIGCRLCVMACPYGNVRAFNEETPRHVLEFAVGDEGVPPQQKGTVSKCTFCVQRLDRGLLPNCIEVCPAKARHFGDLGDERSEVSKLLRTRQYTQLLSNKGTRPGVYFLI